MERLQSACRREGRRNRPSGKSAHVRDDEDEKHGYGSGNTPDIEHDGETNRRQREGQGEVRRETRLALPAFPSRPSGAIKQHRKPARKRSGFTRWEESDFDLKVFHLRGLKIIKVKIPP